MNADRLLVHYEKIADAPDAVERLRRFILDLAVRGKLVEQDPNDEPASELLKRIASVRKMVAASGRKKNKKPVDSSLTEMAFSLPAGWASAQLSELVQVLNGRAYKKAELLESGTPVLRVGNLFTSNHWYYSNLELEKDKYCDEGDLIYAWSASFGPFIWQGPRVIYHYHIWKLPFFSEAHLDKQFLYFFLLQKTQEIKGAGHGISMVHMTKGKMEQLAVPLPPLAEQRRIVAKVDELMVLCDRLETARTEREETRDRLAAASFVRLNVPDPDPAVFQKHATFALDNFVPVTTRPDQIKTLRQTILNLAVCGKLVPQDPNDEPASELLKRVAAEKGRLVKAGKIKKRKSVESVPSNALVFELPSGWTAARFSDILIELQTGPFGSSLHQSDYEIGGTPVINPASMRNGKIVPVEKMAVGENVLERLTIFKLRAGDIVMGRRGEMGRCAVVTKHEEGWLCGTGSLILRLPNGLYPRYLAMLIGSPHVRQYLGGFAVGATMQNLNQSILLKMSIGLPPLAEQHRIVARVDELMALCDQLEASLATGDDTRRRLLDALLHEALASSEEASRKYNLHDHSKNARQTARVTQSVDRAVTDQYVT